MNPVLSEATSKALLKSFFGFDDFKGNQADVVVSVLEGRDTFVMMPTGGGKSLCYQLPALQMDGLAIVVSPLIALMKNQVDAVRSFAAEDGIAHVWNSSLSKREMVQVRQDLSSGHTKLLYMAPESLNKEENIAFLKDLPISFYAIDEAHCISEWGHDFRPEYRQLRHAIQAIQRRPILALTATATPKVMSDILKNLEITDAATFTTSFNRANLFYSVQPKTNVEKDMIRLLREHDGKSAIVYCLSRQKVEEIAQLLQLNGISSLPYHAGLDSGTRARHQDAFLQEDVNVIVATIAFGMGIDKPDVRLVIHHDIPKSLESYYQETGRAGRDGGEGVCVTYYSEKDIEKLDKFLARKPVAEQEIGRQLLQEARGYALTATCRRHYLLHYFGEHYSQKNCGACDNCQGNPSDYDATKGARLILDTVLAGKDNFRTPQVVTPSLAWKPRCSKPSERGIWSNGAPEKINRTATGRISCARWSFKGCLPRTSSDTACSRSQSPGRLSKRAITSSALGPTAPWRTIASNSVRSNAGQPWTQSSLACSRRSTANWPNSGASLPMPSFPKQPCRKWQRAIPLRKTN